jgi:hypothetical protein
VSFRFAMIGIALIATSVAGAAHATVVYSLGAKTAPLTFAAPSNVFATASSLNSFVAGFKETVTNKTGSTTQQNYHTLVGPDIRGAAFAYNIDFNLGTHFSPAGSKSPLLDLELSGNTHGLTGSDFYLEDFSKTGVLEKTTYATTIRHSTNLSLAALLTGAKTDYYDLVLLVPTSAARGLNTLTITGSVPVPGSLMMFGAFLLGLIGLSYGSKARQGW